MEGRVSSLAQSDSAMRKTGFQRVTTLLPASCQLGARPVSMRSKRPLRRRVVRRSTCPSEPSQEP